MNTAYPSDAVPCPYGKHLIFVRRSGSIVAHYGADGIYCRGSERQYCDCHMHEHQVCDICQGTTGNERDTEPASAIDWEQQRGHRNLCAADQTREEMYASIDKARITRLEAALREIAQNTHETFTMKHALAALESA